MSLKHTARTRCKLQMQGKAVKKHVRNIRSSSAAEERSHSLVIATCRHSFGVSLQVETAPDSDAWLAEGAEEIERQLNSRKDEQEGEPPAADPSELAERFKVGQPFFYESRIAK